MRSLVRRVVNEARLIVIAGLSRDGGCEILCDCEDGSFWLWRLMFHV